MLDRFLDYIETNDLAKLSDRILLAVSGGIDSVSMAHLFFKAGFTFDIAHCNFKLRGRESEKDQELVRQLSETYSCRFYSKDFETMAYSQKNNLSVQMAARELRFKWFEELILQNNYTSVAIAHNRDDIVETFLINLIRGTGLKGLTGIKSRRERIIRPLLYAKRSEILSYAKMEKLRYRNDSSNAETKYQRNYLRKQVIPLIEHINPSYIETIVEEAEIFQSVYSLYRIEIEKIRRTITIPGKKTIFSIPKIFSLRLTAAVLYDLISPYGFNYNDSKNLLRLLNSESGKMLMSDRYKLLKDRKTIIIEERKEPADINEFIIENDSSGINQPIKLKIVHFGNDEQFQIPASERTAALDYDKLHFPLALRRWKKGDFFYPLGLKGRKKLSDFFTDHKINRFEKENIWLLISGSAIVWVVGYQLDDRYKITPGTGKIIQFELID